MRRFENIDIRAQADYRKLCSLLSPAGVHATDTAPEASSWEALVELAVSEGVAPLLYDRLRDWDGDFPIPNNILEILKAEYYRSAAQNALLFFELDRILTALHGADIPVIVLKGADLARTLYNVVAQRPMGDIDVLIPERCLERAISLVEDMGFQPEQAWRMPELRRGLRRLLFFEANFDGGMDAKVHLELHWNLVAPKGNRYSPRVDWFWEGTQAASFAGSPALVLEATRNMLFLAGHLMLKHLAFRHGEDRTRLLWFHDLHLLIERHSDSLDWVQVRQGAERFGWQAALLLALQGTKDRFGTTLPEGLLEDLASRTDQRSIRELQPERPRSATRFALSVQEFRHMYWSTRLWVLWALAFPEKRYILWRYDPNPAWLWRLWCFYRWFDILADGVKTIFRRKTVAL